MFQYTHPIPPKWLRNAHAQTIYAKTRQSPTPHYRRELWTDSHQTDLVAYDFVDSPYANAPVVVFFHGTPPWFKGLWSVVEMDHFAYAWGE